MAVMYSKRAFRSDHEIAARRSVVSTSTSVRVGFPRGAVRWRRRHGGAIVEQAGAAPGAARQRQCRGGLQEVLAITDGF